jgi:hypothetical protein
MKGAHVAALLAGVAVLAVAGVALAGSSSSGSSVTMRAGEVWKATATVQGLNLSEGLLRQRLQDAGFGELAGEVEKLGPNRFRLSYLYRPAADETVRLPMKFEISTGFAMQITKLERMEATS